MKAKNSLALISSVLLLGGVMTFSGCTASSDSEAKEVKRITDTQVVTNKLDGVVALPSSKKILDKDWIDGPTEYKMPEGCVTNDKNAIARGELFFNNLSGKTAKKLKAHAKKIGTSLKTAKGKNKPFGNCIACHNTQNGIGAGNIGPDLTNYRAIFVDTGVRDAQWVYQKIADPRVDNAKSNMTINLTSGKLFNEKEICDIVSYLFKK